MQKIFLFLLVTIAFGALAVAPVMAEDLISPDTVPSKLTGTVNVEGIAEPHQLNFQPPQSPVMEKLYQGHMWLLYLTTIISLFVLAIIAYIVVKFNRKANPTPATFTHNVKIEVIWTVVPIIILVAIAIPSVRAHYFIENAPSAEEGTITLKVTGKQWYWTYEYPDHGGFEFDSYMLQDGEAKAAQEPRLLAVDNRVVVPVGTPVRALITGGDVIHAWAIPAFGVKRDAVPGRLNESWFTANKEGLYYGQCSELCGKLHGFMPIAVEVVSKEKFAEWIALKQAEAGIEMPAADVSEEAADATNQTQNYKIGY